MRRLMIVWAAMASVGWAIPYATAEEVSLSPEEVQEGFVSLFNGKDITGFREVQGQPGAFWVEDSVLHGKRDGARAYWLSTENRYGDFEFRMDYKLESGGNSGVFIRVPHYLGRSSTLGMEIQLLDDGGKTGKPTDKETGAIYRVDAADSFNSKPTGEWNSLSILAQGDRIQVTLNGKLINDFDMASNPLTAKRSREGFIGLSAHTNTVRFRNIRIRTIEPGKSA